MLSYEKRAVQWKKRTIVILSLFLLIAVGVLTYLMRQNAASEPTVAQHEETILPLPDTPKKEKIQKPFQVEASAVVDYFDGEDSEVDKFTKFEDVYRSSQGIDYSCNDEQFEIVAMLSGEISDVREDELFGQTVVLKKDNITITMQSLDNVKVKKRRQCFTGRCDRNGGKLCVQQGSGKSSASCDRGKREADGSETSL